MSCSPYADSDTLTWLSEARGIGQLVGTDATITAKGQALFCCMDRAVFVSPDVSTYPAKYGPDGRFASGWSIDSKNDVVVVLVGDQHDLKDTTRSAYSTDAGQTWQPIPTVPASFGIGGTIAVSTATTWLWSAPGGKTPEVTTDAGKTWTPIVLPNVTDYTGIHRQAYYVSRHPIATERKRINTFYVFDSQNGVFRSLDKGKTFEQRCATLTPQGAYAWGVRLACAPSVNDTVFLAAGDVGNVGSAPFQRSTDGAATWTKLPLVNVAAFGFGRKLPGSTFDTIYAVGYLAGVYGVYYSTDNGDTWTYVVDFPMGAPNNVRQLIGDPNRAGRCYVGIAGMGWAYADVK